MKTRIQNLFIALSVLALPALVQAQFTFTTNNGAITITGYNTAAGLNVVIPAMTNGYLVTSIGDGAFEGPSGITNVTIPNSVTSIGDYAFHFCYGLTSVTIPDSVTSIGVAAFLNCSRLTSVIIGNSVTNIGDFAFDNCRSLASVTIPNSVTSIGTYAFAYCNGLTSINVDAANPAYSSMNGVLFDKAQATLLQFPGGLGGSYTIPNSVTSIATNAFAFCTSLTSVTLPNSIINIGDAAFLDCISLTSVTIPNSVTSIGYEAFEYCTSLTSVAIPNSVTGIGVEAFSDCTSLRSVTIPDSVTSIGAYAFGFCSNLTSIHFTGNAPSPTNDSTVFSSDPATVYYLPGTTGWGAMFDGRPTAPWLLLLNPQILNNGDILIQFPGGVPGALYDVEESSNLLTWTVAATDPANAMGSFSFEDTNTAGVLRRFYRAARAFTVGGTLSGLPAGDTVTLQDNGSDNLLLIANGTFTFPTALPDGHAYSVTVGGTSGHTATTCTLTNGSGTISSANVTNVAIQCTSGPTCPTLTGNKDLDMYNAAVSDGTANGGVPAVMLTEHGGPFRVTAVGTCSDNVAVAYSGWAVFTHVVGTGSCSSTTFPPGTEVIQFGTVLERGFGPYQY
jgi:hypothetical protein